MYQMINQKLRIMSCGIEDLSDKRKEELVKVFKGDSIETLTLFYNEEDDLLILNHDREDYELYKKLSEKYLSYNDDERLAFKERVEDRLKTLYYSGTLNVLHSVVWKRKYLQENEEAHKMLKLLNEQHVEKFSKAIPMLEALRRIDTRESEFFFDWNPFMFGYIQGVRAERARRKKAGAL